MHRLNPIDPDISFSIRKGTIDIRHRAATRMGLTRETRISFFLDDEGNLYLKKDATGLHPSAPVGRRHLRFYSRETVRRVFALPDIDGGLPTARFRIGTEEGDGLFPVITRRPL